jgi:hypothetical protein
MRALWYGSFVVWQVLVAADSVRADDQADMKALVDKAIKAAGGEAKLKTFQAFTWKAKGTVHIGDKKAEITIDASMQAADQCRLDMTAEIDGQTRNVSLVINKDKGWFKGPKQANAIPKEILPALLTDFRALRLAQMLLGLKHKDCKLSALGEVKVGDQDAVGIKASRKGFADVDIYFDKKTALPVKCQAQVIDNKENKELSHEFFFSDPKDTGGVKHFTKILFKRDGNKMIEVELSEIKSVDKLDGSIFAKPE